MAKIFLPFFRASTHNSQPSVPSNMAQRERVISGITRSHNTVCISESGLTNVCHKKMLFPTNGGKLTPKQNLNFSSDNLFA
jgi:hypothetical protein